MSGPATAAHADPTPFGDGGTEKGYVWRRSGEGVFGVLMVMVLVAEAAMLGLLVWALLFSSAVSTSGTFGLGSILVGAVTLTAVLIAITTAVVMLVRALAVNRDVRRAPSIAAWTERWRQAIAEPASCPGPPYTEGALEALLEVRESVDASEAPRAAELVVASGADRVLMERLDHVVQESRHRWPARTWRRFRHLGRTLDTLDDLARARVPEAVAPLLSLLGSRDPVVRAMALRAVSRTISSMPPDERRTSAAMDLLGCLRQGRFPRGALEEAILLLGDAGGVVITAVLEQDAGDDPTLVASCLDAAGHRASDSSTPLIGPYLDEDRPMEVRAAAFRALSNGSVLPAGTGARLRAGLDEPNEAVRIQATRAARLLAPDDAVATLVDMLGDHSWWVRRAAAETLALVPVRGQVALMSAAANHPDRYGRDMAEQVLRDLSFRGPPVGKEESA